MKKLTIITLILIISALVVFSYYLGSKKANIISKPQIIIRDTVNYKPVIQSLQNKLENCYVIIDSLKFQLKHKKYEIAIVTDSTINDSSTYIPESFRKLAGYFSGQK